MAIRTWNHETETAEVTFEGAVLDTREENHCDDSDFYAVVWNAEKGEAEKVYYATTRGWTYNNGAAVDATDEVKAAARAWLAEWALNQNRIADQARARVPEAGRTVKVVRGRKVPIGTEARVFWSGNGLAYGWNRYHGRPPKRVGLELASGQRVFIAAENVEVLNPEQYESADDDLRAKAERWAAAEQWYTPFTLAGLAVL